jgi:hypothetical protein
MYLTYSDLKKNQMSIVNQLCKGDEWKIQMKNFENRFPKMFKILTDRVPSKEREISAGKKAR